MFFGESVFLFHHFICSSRIRFCLHLVRARALRHKVQFVVRIGNLFVVKLGHRIDLFFHLCLSVHNHNSLSSFVIRSFLFEFVSFVFFFHFFRSVMIYNQTFTHIQSYWKKKKNKQYFKSHAFVLCDCVVVVIRSDQFSSLDYLATFNWWDL